MKMTKLAAREYRQSIRTESMQMRRYIQGNKVINRMYTYRCLNSCLVIRRRLVLMSSRIF